MKFFTLILSALISFCSYSAAGVQDEAQRIKNDLKARLESQNIKKPAQIAIMNFDEIAKDARDAAAGKAFASALVEAFSSDKDFIVVEREKIENIFKELKLSMAGAVSEKDIKRAGLILGADWLIMGDISESNGEFLVQARVVNSESAAVAAASSIPVEKSKLIKEADERISMVAKNYFSLLYGDLDLNDLNAKLPSAAVELRHNTTKNQYISFSALFSLKESDDLMTSKYISVVPEIFNNPLTIEEKIKSITAFSLNYGFIFKMPLKTVLRVEAGPGFNVVKSEQKLFSNAFITSMNVNLPKTYEQKYSFPSLNLSASMEKRVWKTVYFGLDFNYKKFSFDREILSEGNSGLKSYLDPLKNNISSSSKSIFGRFSFAF